MLAAGYRESRDRYDQKQTAAAEVPHLEIRHFLSPRPLSAYSTIKP
jgi:hypothetical protein